MSGNSNETYTLQQLSWMLDSNPCRLREIIVGAGVKGNTGTMSRSQIIDLVYAIQHGEAIPDWVSGIRPAGSGKFVRSSGTPYTPGGFVISGHIHNDDYEWGPSAVSLHLTKRQESGLHASFSEMVMEVPPEIANANTLDFLMADQALIPLHWQLEGSITFWGTQFQGYGGDSAVFGMKWNGKIGQWERQVEFDSTNARWGIRSPTLILVKDH